MQKFSSALSLSLRRFNSTTHLQRNALRWRLHTPWYYSISLYVSKTCPNLSNVKVLLSLFTKSERHFGLSDQSLIMQKVLLLAWFQKGLANLVNGPLLYTLQKNPNSCSKIGKYFLGCPKISKYFFRVFQNVKNNFQVVQQNI